MVGMVFMTCGKSDPVENFQKKWGPANAIWRAGRMWVPHGVEIERWLCNPRVSGSIPGTDNLEKLFIWMKIHGITQKQTVTEL